MKKLIAILFYSCGIISHTLSQAASDSLSLYSKRMEDIIDFLKPGVYVPFFRGQINTAMRRQELSDKTNEAYRKNLTWFVDSAKHIGPADSAIYFAKIGLTQDEYREYQRLSSWHSEYTRKDTLIISRKANIISFKGSGDLSAMDSVRINIAENTISFKGFKLRFVEKIENNNQQSNPAIPSTMYYSYEYYDSDDTTGNPLANIKNIKLNAFGISIGQQTATKKTILKLDDMQFEKMKFTTYIDIDLILEK